MNETSISVAQLALELGTDVARLTQRLDPEMITTDDVGRKVVPITVAARLLTERNAAEAERIERRRLEIAAAKAKPRRSRARGVDLGDLGGLTPAEAMVAAGGPPEYDGHGIPRPSANPLVFKDEGGLIGPARKPRVKK